MSQTGLLLFTQSSIERKLADPPYLVELLNKVGHSAQFRWSTYDDLLFDLTGESISIYDTRNDHALEDYDVIYFRTWASQVGQANAVARVCESLKIPFVDNEVLTVGSQNKLSQYVILFNGGISLPKTLIGTVTNLVHNYSGANFQFPFIMKAMLGTRGQDNFLINSAAELDKLFSESPNEAYILQEFIPNDGDYRILIVGGKAKVAIRRSAVTGSHLNNVSQGGHAELVPLQELDPELIAASEKASALFDRQISGVDMVVSKQNNECYCFEVNRAPQIEHSSFEKIKADLLVYYLASLGS